MKAMTFPPFPKMARPVGLGSILILELKTLLKANRTKPLFIYVTRYRKIKIINEKSSLLLHKKLEPTEKRFTKNAKTKR